MKGREWKQRDSQEAIEVAKTEVGEGLAVHCRSKGIFVK